MGGFKRGNIIYDPKDVLSNYSKQLIVTTEIINLFKKSRETSTSNNLKSLEIAVHRQQPVEYIKSLNYLLITFSIQLYLEHEMLPMAPKWIEKDAKKFGWDTPLLDVIKKIKSELSFMDISKLLSETRAQGNF